LRMGVFISENLAGNGPLIIVTEKVEESRKLLNMLKAGKKHTRPYRMRFSSLAVLFEIGKPGPRASGFHSPQVLSSSLGSLSKSISFSPNFKFFLLSQTKPLSGVITAMSTAPPTPGISPGSAKMPSENRCIAEVV